ncbi:MAG: hypothetical protein Fur0037_28400 [Planctomycetota bacterium]
MLERGSREARLRRSRHPTILPLEVHPNVQKLLDLQKVDQEIASLRADIESLPEEEARRRRRLEELQRIKVEKKEKADRAELESRGLEKGIRGGDEEIRKLTERLATVRNNAEYQATLYQIESVKQERDQMQERCLALLETLDAVKAEAREAAEAEAAERKVFERFLAEAEKLRAEREREIAGIMERREALCDGIPPDLAVEYERLFKTRGRLAVCAVEGGYCQGCYNRVTTNDQAKLLGGSSVVACNSCQRILYLDR